MKKLKYLSQEDLDQISDFVSSTAQNFILQQVSRKEIDDIDIRVELSYEDELGVDISIDLVLDELSDKDPQIISEEAVDMSHEALDKFLDENFRV